MAQPGWVAVTCRSCNAWIDLRDPTLASKVGFEHLMECPNADRYRFVPAWSIGWPWVHGEDQRFTFDVAWKAVGNITAVVPEISTGGDIKLWHPFAPQANEISTMGRLDALAEKLDYIAGILDNGVCGYGGYY